MCQTAQPEDEIEHTEENEDFDDTEIIRAKWLYDNCSTLDEIIERLHQEIEYIKKLKEDGWKLIEPVNDDYGYIRKIN